MEEFKNIFIDDVKSLKRDNLHLKLRVQELENEMETIKRMLKIILTKNKPTDKEASVIQINFLEKSLIKNKLFKKNFYSKYIFFKKWCSNIKLKQKIKKDKEIICKIETNKIWYMNGNHEDIKIWDTFIKNKIVLTWNQNGRNESIKTKLKKNDIITLYIRKKGFNSILRVIDTPKILNDNELSKYYPAWKHKYTFDEWKQDAKDRNYERIYIPVEFLVTTDKHFVKQEYIKNWKYDWTIARGSNCITSSNPHWKEQVIEIYKYLINKQ